MCIIEPSSAADVSKAMQITIFTGAKHETRSGGHNPNQGWASNNGGVLIDSVNVNAFTLCPDSSYVSVTLAIAGNDCMRI